jgi:soluble cytochrome b562
MRFSIILLALIGCISSCTSKKEVRVESPRVESKPAQGVKRTNDHWIQGEQLRAMMATLSSQAEKLPRGLPDDVESHPATKQTFAQAIATADILSSAAQRIPLAVAGVEMSEADRNAFNATAQTLANQAATFKKWAEARDVEEMQRSLTSIKSTCTSCHVRYRDFSGQLLWFRQAQLNTQPNRGGAIDEDSSIAAIIRRGS